MGDNQQAMVYFSWAQDIDPKGNLNDIEKSSMDHFGLSAFYSLNLTYNLRFSMCTIH